MNFIPMKKAFTLVELMIVVVIVGLLAAMVIPAVQKVREASVIKRYEQGDRSREVVTAYEQYVNEGRIPRKKVYITTEEGDVKETITINGKRYKLVPLE